MSGTLEGIRRRRAHGGSMDRREHAVLVAGEGLPGSVDRGGIRQVTLITVGRTRIRIHGETRPCGLMEEAVPGLRGALGVPWRGAVYGEVIEGGTLALGDPAAWVEDEGGSDARSS